MTGVHRGLQREALEERTALVARRAPGQILDELIVDWGVSQNAISRLVGVSHTAIRKWRRGETVAAENRRRLARLLAFLDTLRSSYPIGDPASWLEMPFAESSSVCPADLYAANRTELLLEYAGGRIGPQSVLDAFDPDWRVRADENAGFSLVRGSDGHPSIVVREPM